MVLIPLHLFLRQGKHLFTDQRRHRNFYPLRARPLAPGVVAVERYSSLAMAVSPLGWPHLLFAITSFSLVSRIAQHLPHHRRVPRCLPSARGHLVFIQQVGNGVDTYSSLRVSFKHPPHHLGLRFNYLVIGCGSITLAHVPVAVGSRAKHTHRPLSGLVPFPPATAFDDLRPFVFGDHSLELP